MAQTYAYDFTRLSWKDGKVNDFHEKGNIKYIFGLMKLHDCYAWSQPVTAPFTGTVVHAADGWPERQTVHLVRDVFTALKNGLFFNDKKHEDLRPLAGNYLILEGEDYFAFLAHFKTGSITVKLGDNVVAGNRLGEVGHSGNSTTPHLHFHLMDGPDPRYAAGIPCSFDNYEVSRDDSWVSVCNGMPGRLERIRMRA